MCRTGRTTVEILSILCVLGQTMDAGSASNVQSHAVFALAKARGRLFTGSRNGEIGVFDRWSEAQRESRASLLRGDNHSTDIPVLDGVQSEMVAVRQNTGSWEATNTLRAHASRIEALQVVSDTIVSASGDGSLRVWGIDDLKCRKVIQAHSAAVTCMALWNVSGDAGGEVLLLSGSLDGRVRLWDAMTHGAWESAGELMNDGRAIAQGTDSSSGAGTSLAFGHPRARCLVVVKPPPFDLDVAPKCAESNEEDQEGLDLVTGAKAVAGCLDSHLWVWDLETRSLEYRLQGHIRPVVALTLLRSTLCSGSADGTIRIWNTRSWTSQQVLEMSGFGVPSSLAIAPARHDADAPLLLAGTTGKVCVWRMDTWQPCPDLKHTCEHDSDSSEASSSGSSGSGEEAAPAGVSSLLVDLDRDLESTEEDQRRAWADEEAVNDTSSDQEQQHDGALSGRTRCDGAAGGAGVELSAKDSKLVAAVASHSTRAGYVRRLLTGSDDGLVRDWCQRGQWHCEWTICLCA